MLAEARYFIRMLDGYRRFIRTPPAPNPDKLVLANLARRPDNFLDLMRRVVFADPLNPYNRLFRWAGCSLGDLERAVIQDGLEAALDQLRRAGIYLSHDEFKGRKPIERPGLSIPAGPAAFVNPLVRGTLETTSSGSRSRGTVTRPSVEFQLYREAQDAVLMEQFEPGKRSILTVQPILPSTIGFNRMLTFGRSGTPVERWFTLGGSWRDSGHYRTLTNLLIVEGRLMGAKVPFPTCIDKSDFSPVARWISEKRSRGRDVLFVGPVSMAVLVTSAATDGGRDIRGTTFVCGGEPLTSARREVIESAGCRVFPRYATSELGCVGSSCVQMAEGNSYHVLRDSVAVISSRRKAPMTDLEVDSLLFTTLLPVANYVLVNVEMDDCGKLEPVRCDCRLKAMGFTQQVSEVYSYGKLTGQGVTLLAGDLLNVLEKSLPSRFGGTPADYQLVELDAAGVNLELRIHPRIPAGPEGEVREFFLAEVRKMWGGSLASRQWGQTGAIRVVWKEPAMSGGRKINPLHLLGTPGPPHCG